MIPRSTLPATEKGAPRRGASLLPIAIMCLAAAACCLVGCPRREEPTPRGTAPDAKRLVIKEISTEIAAFDEEGNPLALAPPLEEWTREALAQTKTLSLAPATKAGTKGPEGSRLRIAARMAPDGFTGTLHALVSARIPRSGTIPLRADVNATRPRPTGPDGGPGPAWTKADYRAHLQKALGDVLQALDEQAHLVVASNDGLIAALEHGEPDVRVMAARTLGTRQATEAVEPLCAMLKREKNQVGEAAVGALAALRQQKAVPCLIQWAGSDLRRLVVTMEPLSAIGGQEAQAFLEMIASGHDDPRIRRAAEEALRRMGATSKQ